jgi:F0F1-type ATP synthase assembly protein I
VFFRKKDKPRERFYLLPGQGGRNYHRKQQFIMRWTIAVALIFGVLVGVVMWWLSRPKL